MNELSWGEFEDFADGVEPSGESAREKFAALAEFLAGVRFVTHPADEIEEIIAGMIPSPEGTRS